MKTIREIIEKYKKDVRACYEMNGTSDENIAALRKTDELKEAFFADMAHAGHTRDKAQQVWLDAIVPKK